MRWTYRLLASSLFLIGLYIFIQVVRGKTVLGLSSSTAFIIVLLLIFLSAAPFLIHTLYEIRFGKNAWREIAKQIGLTFLRKGGPGIPDIGHVTGIFCGRQLTLFAQSYYSELGYEPDYQTVVTIRLNQPVLGEMELHLVETIGPENEVKREGIAFDRAVEIHSKPESLKPVIVFDPEIRHGLLRVRKDSLIRVKGTSITLRQSPNDGMERDIPYLLFLFDLLSDLADVVEQEDWNQYLVNATIEEQ